MKINDIIEKTGKKRLLIIGSVVLALMIMIAIILFVNANKKSVNTSNNSTDNTHLSDASRNDEIPLTQDNSSRESSKIDSAVIDNSSSLNSKQEGLSISDSKISGGNSFSSTSNQGGASGISNSKASSSSSSAASQQDSSSKTTISKTPSTPTNEKTKTVIAKMYNTSDSGEKMLGRIYEYNNLGNISKINNYFDDKITSYDKYEYNANNELIKVSSYSFPSNSLSDYETYKNGEKFETYLGTGNRLYYFEYQYDDKGRVKKVFAYNSDGSSYGFQDYLYDSKGNNIVQDTHFAAFIGYTEMEYDSNNNLVKSNTYVDSKKTQLQWGGIFEYKTITVS